MLFGKYRKTSNGHPRGPALVSNEINAPQSLEFQTRVSVRTLTVSEAGRTVFAENYVGLPYEEV
jgi:hypothetical protein